MTAAAMGFENIASSPDRLAGGSAPSAENGGNMNTLLPTMPSPFASGMSHRRNRPPSPSKVPSPRFDDNHGKANGKGLFPRARYRGKCSAS